MIDDSGTNKTIKVSAAQGYNNRPNEQESQVDTLDPEYLEYSTKVRFSDLVGMIAEEPKMSLSIETNHFLETNIHLWSIDDQRNQKVTSFSCQLLSKKAFASLKPCVDRNQISCGKALSVDEIRKEYLQSLSLLKESKFWPFSYTHWEEKIVWDIKPSTILTPGSPTVFQPSGDLFSSSTSSTSISNAYSRIILNESMSKDEWGDYVIWETTPNLEYFKPCLTEMDSSLMLEKTTLDSQISKETKKSPHASKGSLDKFNISNDKYYQREPKFLPSTDNLRNEIKETEAIELVHSIPALKLSRPFYKSWTTKSELRSFHRPSFTIPPLNVLISFENDNKMESEETIQSIPKSTKDLTILGPNTDMLFVEYSEEHPPLMQKEGMGSLLYKYYRKKGPKDSNPTYPRQEGINAILEYKDPSPFIGFGDVRPGHSIFSLQNNLFRVPLFSHSSPSNSFLLIRNFFKGKIRWDLKELPSIFLAGQTLPMAEVYGPQSRKANIFCKNRVEVAAYRAYQKTGNLSKRVKITKICKMFPQFPESILRKWLKDTSDYIKVGRDTGWWILKKNAPSLSEDELRALVTPEMVCKYESMLAGKQRLLDAGLGHLADEEEDPENSTTLDDEIKAAPWHLTRNFLLATQGKALVELTGSSDPTGCGEGFSFNRIPLKSTFHKRWVGGGDPEMSSDNIKYSIAQQQAAYREQIMKIWDAQRVALSNTIIEPNSFEEACFQDTEESVAKKEPGDGEEDFDSVSVTTIGSLSSYMSKTREKGHGSKYLIIKRKFKNSSNTESEIVGDPRIIVAYLEQKKLLEKKLRSGASIPSEEVLETDSLANPKRKSEEDTSPSAKKIKCGNCGAYGHMKTNRACPMFFSKKKEESNDTFSFEQKEMLPVSSPLPTPKISLNLSILNDTKSQKRMAMSEISKCLSKIVSELSKLPNIWPFLLPVQEKIAPNYYSIIKNPMDLSTLKKNVSNRKYTSADDFIDDVSLIHTNCITYNSSEHPFSNIAQLILKTAKDAVEKNNKTITDAEQILKTRDLEEQKQ